jgi:hypothetical protein
MRFFVILFEYLFVHLFRRRPTFHLYAHSYEDTERRCRIDVIHLTSNEDASYSESPVFKST